MKLVLKLCLAAVQGVCIAVGWRWFPLWLVVFLALVGCYIVYFSLAEYRRDLRRAEAAV